MATCKRLARIKNNGRFLGYRGPCEGLAITEDIFNVLKRMGANIEWYTPMQGTTKEDPNTVKKEQTAVEKIREVKNKKKEYREEIAKPQYDETTDAEKKDVVDMDTMEEFENLEIKKVEPDKDDLRIENKLEDTYYEEAFEVDVAVAIDDNGSIETLAPSYELKNKLTYFSEEDLANKKDFTVKVLKDEILSRGFVTPGKPYYPHARITRTELCEFIRLTQPASPTSDLQSFDNNQPNLPKPTVPEGTDLDEVI